MLDFPFLSNLTLIHLYCVTDYLAKACGMLHFLRVSERTHTAESTALQSIGLTPHTGFDARTL